MAFSSAFQGNAFQINAFQIARRITSSRVLYKPVDYQLAGDVPIKDRYREYSISPRNIRTRGRVPRTGVSRIGGDAPSFTTTTTKRGYE